MHETWTLTVPDDFTPTPGGDTLEEALEAAGMDGWTCEDKISDETDREIQDVEIGAAHDDDATRGLAGHAFVTDPNPANVGCASIGDDGRCGWEQVDHVCRECQEAPAEDHGMCGSCLHNAYRSGWSPGDPS